MTCLDLEKYWNILSNISTTFPMESRSDINLIAISPDSKILVVVDVDGFSQIINLISKNTISHFNFK